MTELLSFFKDIFMMTDETSKSKIGLSQFKEEDVKQPEPVVEKQSKDIKISDLMRRSA